MALNYTDIFTDIGKFIKLADEYRMSAVGSPLGFVDLVDLSGTHTPAGASATVLTDTASAWTTDELIGLTIKNITDASVGVITSNTATTATVANGLSGGTGDNFEQNDVYEIDYPVPNIPWSQDEIETQLESTGRRDILDSFFTLMESQKDSMISLSNAIAAKVTERLLNRETVLNELPGVVSSNIADVIQELSREMINDAEDINGTSMGAVPTGATGEASNEGDVFFYFITTLDGFSAPSSGFAASSNYSGVESQLAVPTELMTWTISQDRDNNGVTGGHEVFLMEGQPAPSDPLGWRTEGSGTSTSVPMLNSYGAIANRSFETVAAGIPTSWTLDQGAITTELTIETGVSDIYRGLNAIGLNGTGTDVEIRQSIANLVINPDRYYKFAIAVKSDGLLTETGTLELRIEFVSDSGGYTAVSGEFISIDLTSLNGQTTYLMENFDWLTPKNIPDDLQISIKLVNATAGIVFLDSLSFGPYIYANGFGTAPVAKEDANQSVLSDRYTKTITNDEGIFQRFFRRFFKVQLPYQTDGSETQPDTLAT